MTRPRLDRPGRVSKTLTRATGETVPVRRHDGRVVAAISLGGPSTRFTYARLPGLTRAVREAGGRISQRLGWVPAAASAPRRSAS